VIAYLDASAVVPLMKAEDHSGRLRAFLDGLDDDLYLLISGRLLETEVRRTAIRQGIAQDVATAALKPISLVEHERGDFRTAGLLRSRGLGSLDALHLATALRAQADVMVTQDARLAEASRAEGLELLAIEETS